MEININDIKKEDIKTLPESIIRLFHNEYIRRWTKNNKEKVNQYQRNHYNKYKKNHNNIKKEDKDHNDIKKINPLNFNRL